MKIPLPGKMVEKEDPRLTSTPQKNFDNTLISAKYPENDPKTGGINSASKCRGQEGQRHIQELGDLTGLSTEGKDAAAEEKGDKQTATLKKMNPHNICL